MIPPHVQNRPAEIRLFRPPAALEILDLDESQFLNGEFLFQNPHPIEIEIGCGKGRFLLERAAEFPGINFIGIDRVSKWMKFGQVKCVKRDLQNLKFMKAPAGEVIRRFPPETVSIFHIYFPDPWHKRRHRKRRLVKKDFIELLRGKLLSGGQIEFATDDGEYFEEVKKAAENFDWASKREAAERLLGAGKTHYESKYASAGRELYYLEFRK